MDIQSNKNKNQSKYIPHVIGQNTPIAAIILEPHDATVHEIHTLPLMVSQEFGQNGRNKDILFTVQMVGSRFEDENFLFNAIFIASDFRAAVY